MNKELEERDKEFEDLQEENEKLRESINSYLPIDEIKNDMCWNLINNLVENEIEQEELCNK